ncbi:hypothetical protein CN878_02005 [Ochrobactrum sp. 695/2009]|nr:hypothetical protein CN881_18290 [Ochrobactrum sp. 721/2009]PJT15512.1 hypothetical protein CN880_13880 [Ochrobactrum sp. 720/2009]PJT19633.1 hypothetical protein CN879_19715 [Ochrobactrum sp. 715/2009]PJT31499.1 hypothetical protein CN878_02005 [Ochrobactrum sp. 695/2009]PJT32368.1 hypothetical protein CN877_20745 [Ochrobactrum sp. 689/2009]
MKHRKLLYRTVASIIASVLLAGCGTVKEKTAPCKRPANLTSFAENTRKDCGPMALVNSDGTAAQAAINAMATQ